MRPSTVQLRDSKTNYSLTWSNGQLCNDKRIFKNLDDKVVKELRKAKANFFLNTIKEAKGNSK